MGRLNLAATHPVLASGEVLPWIVEADDPDAVPGVVQQLGGLGVRVEARTVGPFIRAFFDAGTADLVAGLEGVRVVSYDQPVWIRQPPRILDPVLGFVAHSQVTVPTGPLEAGLLASLTLPLLPLGLLAMGAAQLGVQLPEVKAPNLVIVPTGETRLFLELPQDPRETEISIPVAVLDTGVTVPHPLLGPDQWPMELLSTTGEPPFFDGMGHGQWCATAAFGGRFPTRFGVCQGVARAGPGSLTSIKCLSNIGFTHSFNVLVAMDLAIRRGAQVVSMSLGGPLTGSVQDDPQCRFIELNQDRAIFVVAAGNSGPDPWEVGTPGASPFALTVAAWSTLYDSVAIFSSRGPSGAFYRDNPEVWDRDLAVYGENLLKPDVAAPGGGPGSVLVAPPGQLPDPPDLPAGSLEDWVYSGVTGWLDGVGDLVPLSGFGAMRGTSMATPHVAGLVAYALDRGLIGSAQDVKGLLRATQFTSDNLAGGVPGGKDVRVGYGLATLGRLLPGG